MATKRISEYLKRERKRSKALEYANLTEEQRKRLKKDRKALKAIKSLLSENEALKEENKRLDGYNKCLKEESERLRREVRELRAAMVTDESEPVAMGCRRNIPLTHNERLEHSYEFLKEENKLC